MQSLHAKSVDFTAMTVSSHEVEYVNGTLCSLNGRMRQANVKVGVVTAVIPYQQYHTSLSGC